MRPVRVGSACWKVQVALDEAMSEGTLQLSPELAAHVSHCARCKPEVDELQSLLTRLRTGAAGVGLSQVPAVVDRVIAQVSAESARTALPDMAKASLVSAPGEGVDWRWLFGQVAGIAAAFLMLVGGLTWLGFKVAHVATGVSPSDAAASLLTPFRDWVTALFR